MSHESSEKVDAQVEGSAPPRILVVDRYRGLLVMLMVAGDFVAGVASTPAFLLHEPDIGLTVADTVAPAFVFIIGLLYGPSFARRRIDDELGTLGAARHVVMRYLALMGIGAIITAGSVSVAGVPNDWGVLQALGIAGLLCLIVIRLPTLWRAAAGLLLLVGYQVLLDTVALETVLASNHGGLPGSLGWAALLILSTVVADIWRRGPRAYAICCAGLVVIALLSALVVPVSKHRVSLSFVLITLALSAVVLLVLEVLSRRASTREGLLSWWGRNALALYLLHLLILGGLSIPLFEPAYADAPFWAALLLLIGVLGGMSAIAGALHARRLHWRL